MKIGSWRGWWLGLMVALGGCASQTAPPPPGGGTQAVIAQPYESCAPGDVCTLGTDCAPTTLPASAGYTGYLCTVSCAGDADCPQDLDNYASICVNDQCYTQCPDGGGSCPYGTGCVSFIDSEGFAVNICTP